MEITYGTHTLDTANFHPNSINALIRRGVSHFLGNEMDSKAHAWRAREDVARAEAAKSAGKTEFVPVSDDEKTAKKVEFQREAIQSILDGTIGTAARGPRVDPITVAVNAIAKQEILQVLKTQGIKTWPKVDEHVTFSNGTKRTSVELLTNWLAGVDRNGLFGPKGQPNGSRIRKEAEKRVAEAARKVKKAEEAAKAEALDVSDL